MPTIDLFVQKTVVKKVRLTEADAAELARLAKRRNTTESEILREGIHRVGTVEARRKNIHALIALADEEGGGWDKTSPDVKW